MARRPIRLIKLSDINEAYPMELVADESNGDLHLKKTNGSVIKIKNVVPKITKIQDASSNLIGNVDPETASTITIPTATRSKAGLVSPTDLTALDACTTNLSNHTSKAASASEAGHIILGGAVPAAISSSNPSGAVGSSTKAAREDHIHPNIAITTTYNATVTTTWTGTASPYSQAITVSGILSTDNPIVDVVVNSTLETNKKRIENFSNIYRIVTAANKITVYSYEKTDTSVPIQLKCIRNP